MADTFIFSFLAGYVLAGTIKLAVLYKNFWMDFY